MMHQAIPDSRSAFAGGDDPGGRVVGDAVAGVVRDDRGAQGIERLGAADLVEVLQHPSHEAEHKAVGTVWPLGDDVAQDTKAVDCDLHRIAGLQRERVRRHQAGTAHQEGARGEGVGASEIAHEFVEAPV